VTAETLHDLRHDLTNLAGSDNANRATTHIETHQAVECEVTLAHSVVGAMDVSIERQHQRDRVFRNSMRRVSGDSYDADACFYCGRKIDVIEACASQRNESRSVSRQLFDDWRIKAIVHEDANSRKASCQLYGLTGKTWLKEGQFMFEVSRSLAKKIAVMWFGAEDGNAHVKSIPLKVQSVSITNQH
jgi:hypothetical protein